MSVLMLALGSAFAAEIVVGEHTASVAEAIAVAQPGDTVVLGPGEWPGPVRVDRPVRITSLGGVLVGDSGTTLSIRSPGVVVDGLEVRGSGDDLRGPDACLWIGPEAIGAVVRDSQLSDCLFGIWLHEVSGARIEGNTVVGRPDSPPHSKGNGIHLFDSSGLVVRGNTVEGARDGIYVSATEDSVIADNVVSHQRYGIHYMYSYDNTIDGNTANHNSGGIALMQSRNLSVTDNTASFNVRQGILFRDAQYSTITGNEVEGNGEGLFFFSSLDNEIAHNVVRGNQIGARVWAGTERNAVHDNAFIANREQVFYVSASDQHWEHNYWSDYLGWDQDADGRGDRPYRNDAFVAQLLHRYPAAVLLLNSPTLELLGRLQTQLPALAVPTVIDDAPRLSPSVREEVR